MLCSSLQVAGEREAVNVAGTKLKIQCRADSLLHLCLSLSDGLLQLAGTERPRHRCPAAVFVCCQDVSVLI